MPIIEGELQTYTETALTCSELAHFSCGDKRHAYEATVERIVALYCDGGLSGDVTLRVTRELPSRALVAVSHHLVEGWADHQASLDPGGRVQGCRVH